MSVARLVADESISASCCVELVVRCRDRPSVEVLRSACIGAGIDGPTSPDDEPRLARWSDDLDAEPRQRPFSSLACNAFDAGSNHSIRARSFGIALPIRAAPHRTGRIADVGGRILVISFAQMIGRESYDDRPRNARSAGGDGKALITTGRHRHVVSIWLAVSRLDRLADRRNGLFSSRR